MDGQQRREPAATRGSRRIAPAVRSGGGPTCCGGARAIHGGKGRSAFGGSVRRKVRELRRLVPGGRQLPADRLFLRTADYIFRLRLQVQVLRALSKLYMP